MGFQRFREDLCFVSPDAVNVAKKKEVFRQVALATINTPFKYKGKTEEGLDCRGLGIYLYNKVGIDLTGLDEEYPYDFWKYPKYKDILLNAISPHFELKEGVGTIECGNLMLFSFRSVACHLGFYIGRQEFVHSLDGVGVRKENTTTSSWSIRFLMHGKLKKGLC